MFYLKKVILGSSKITSALCLTLLLIACFICSFGFSLLFYTNGEIQYINGTINTEDATLTTVILVVMVVAMEGSKIVISLSKVFFKAKSKAKKANKLLIALFFASIVASMSFFLISNTDYSPGDKIINALADYIPMGIFQKHLVLLTNTSISIFIEILILFLPDFIVNIFVDTDEHKIINEFGFVLRIINLVMFFIDKKISKLEQDVGIDKNISIEVKDNVKDKDIKDKKNVLTNSKVKDKEVKDKIEYPKEVKDKIEYPKEVKDNVKDTKVKDILNKNVKDNPKPQIKTPKVVDLKFIEVARYILDEFNDGELIKWDKIKNFSGLNDEYSLKKLRKYLKAKDIIRTEGKKSYRNNCPKSVLKKLNMS